MKKVLILSIFSLSLIVLSTAVGAAVLSPGLDVIANESKMTVSQLKGETVVFEAEQFSDAVGSKDFKSITVTSLPEKSEGTLYFGDVEAVCGQMIKKSSVSKLRLEPSEGAETASFGFTFNDSYSMTCSVVFDDKINTAPTALVPVALTVPTKSEVKAQMRGTDADGDSLRYEIVDYPRGGSVEFDTKTGEFTYSAGSMVMNDSFTYRVRDDAGNTSKTVKYNVNVIDKNEVSTFSDMSSGSNVYAADCMAEGGYMTVVEDRGKVYFSPESEVSRIDFLVSAMNVFGADKIPTVENTGFADDSSIDKKYKGYVYSAAKLGIISAPEEGKEVNFEPHRAITKAEASIILNNIIGYEAKTVKSVEGVPVWAQDAVCAMYELGVYDLNGSEAKAQSTLSKEESAVMLYNVMYLVGE